MLEYLKNEKVYSRFIDHIWSADLSDMKLIRKFNKGIRFLLCVIDTFSNYAWVIHLKDKKGVTVINAFQKFLDESTSKPNKIWRDKGSEFYNRSVKSWLQDNNIGKSVVPEKFIRTLKNKMYKYTTSISKIAILINKMI